MSLEPGDRVCLVSENRPEWLIADLGIMAAGCVTVPTYTTNTTRDHAHILGNSGARAVIVSSQKLARNLVPAVLTSAECHHIIGIEDIRAGQVPDWVNVHHWAELTAGEADVPALREREKKVGRSDLACIIYTSGTGGAPPGAPGCWAPARVTPISMRARVNPAIRMCCPPNQRGRAVAGTARLPAVAPL